MLSISKYNTYLQPTFGSAIGSRAFASGEYRFGFNNFENDNEVIGVGNYISFGDYGYDPRTGRRFNQDPLFKKYPSESNYIFVSNNPTVYRDLKGKDKTITYIIKTEFGPFVRTVVQKNIVEFGLEKYSDGMGYSYRPTAYDLNQTITIDMASGKSVIGEVTRGASVGLVEGLRQRSESLVGKGETFENRGGWMFTANDGAGSAGQTTKNKAVEVSDIGTLLTYLGASKYGIKTLIDTRKKPEEVVNQFAELAKTINEKKAMPKAETKAEEKGDTTVSVIRMGEVKIDQWENKSQYGTRKDTTVRKDDLGKLKEKEDVQPAVNKR